MLKMRFIPDVQEMGEKPNVGGLAGLNVLRREEFSVSFPYPFSSLLSLFVE